MSPWMPAPMSVIVAETAWPRRSSGGLAEDQDVHQDLECGQAQGGRHEHREDPPGAEPQGQQADGARGQRGCAEQEYAGGEVRVEPRYEGGAGEHADGAAAQGDTDHRGGGALLAQADDDHEDGGREAEVEDADQQQRYP